MSVVGQITWLCGWECLLEPVVAWTSAHCFCLIKVLIWPSSDLFVPWLVFEVFLWWWGWGWDLMVCVFGLFIPPPAASVTQTGNITRENIETWGYIFDWELCWRLYSRKYRGGAVWYQALLAGFKTDGKKFGSTSKSLLSWLSVLESTTTP